MILCGFSRSKKVQILYDTKNNFVRNRGASHVWICQLCGRSWHFNIIIIVLIPKLHHCKPRLKRIHFLFESVPEMYIQYELKDATTNKTKGVKINKHS